MRRVVATVCLALLAGCAAVAPGRHEATAVLDSYAFEGRFSLRNGNESFAGRVSWRHADGADRVLVADPFGGGVAEIDHAPRLTRVRLADGSVREGSDGDALLTRLTGVPLPVARIGGWLTGRLAIDASVARDALGRVAGLERDGWRVRFEYAEDVVDALPSRIVAMRAEGPELRMAIERWEVER